MNTNPDTNTPNFSAGDDNKLPTISIPAVAYGPDLASILGLTLSFGLIIAAIMMGQSNASFFNAPSFLIVVLGTMTATMISFSGSEIISSGKIMLNGFVSQKRQYPIIAKALMDIANVARKRGFLALSSYEEQTKKEPFLGKSLQLVIDGFNPSDIERILKNEIESNLERDKRASSMLRRGAEIAPAMGLIGTLVGLVQMLADLENPETIGPAMALALLTTFYGAILGSIVLSPLAAKLDKNLADNLLMQTLTLKTVMSILRQENPRNLEHMLNSELPPSQRIVYFD